MVDQDTTEDGATITGDRLAVLGSPIAHSRSPRLHAAAYAVLGLPWEYSAVEVSSERLPAFIGGLDDDWRGLSLTMPLKQAVLPVLHETDRMARLTGGVNTVLFQGTGRARTLHGFNTDVSGIVRSLAETGTTRVDHVQILGGGATAASALAAAAELGAESVQVSMRAPSKAGTLVGLGHELGLIVSIGSLAAAGEPPLAPQLVISTLPGGTETGVVFPAELRAASVLLDVAYEPWPSELARDWQDAGGVVVSGLGMLLHQALLQVRIFVSGDSFQALPNEVAVLAAMRESLTAEAVEGW
ncbi:shikimate dehydrogenase [Luethyella okanaganae]|uniref:Shikimate dehydrogenase n=1 Tax=Luethyella okanaganae TaxID=69372 RepID=A0ABW1VDA5_9MICO